MMRSRWGHMVDSGEDDRMHLTLNANNERTEAEAATGQGAKHGAELGVRAEITAEDAAAAVVAKGAGSAEGTMLASEAKGL